MVMQEQSSYTSSLEVQPINAERDFARSMEQGGFGTGISGSPGREFARSPYESGGTFNNVMRQREMAQDPSHLRNIKPPTRATTRTSYAPMSINAPGEINDGGGLYG